MSRETLQPLVLRSEGKQGMMHLQSATARAGLLLVGSAVVLFLVYRCWKDGAMASRGWRVARATQPVLYWLLMTMFLVLAGVLVWAAAELV